MRSAMRTSSCCSLLLLFASCATQEGFQVRVMRPAPANLGQYEVLAVDHFGGVGCDLVENELTAALRRAKNPFTGQADFEVMERADVDRMLDDIRSNPGNNWDERSMAVLDRWKTAEILIKGHVHDHSVVDEVCETEIVDPQGVLHIVFERQCTANVDVTIEAVEGGGESIFDTANLREGVTRTVRSTDGPPPSIDHAALLAAARQKVMHRYLQRIMPHEEFVTVRLFVDDDVSELHIGNGYAKVGDWDEALRSYEVALEAMTGELAEVRYKALFNVGVALLYTNRFAEARDSLKHAYAAEQDQAILAQLQNVDRREQEYHALLEQGAAQPH